MSKAEEKKAEEKKAEKSKFKVRLRINSDGSSTIFRGEGLPYIDDKTEKAVQWLSDKGYKAEEVEIIGEKPKIWETVYPSIKAAEPVAVEPPQIVTL